MRLSGEKLAVICEASRRKLINFAEFVDPKYEAQPFHEEIATKLQEAFERVRNGGKARIILEVPPRHGKSELATIKFPAWVLGICPEYPVIVASYSQNLAEDFGLKTRDLMQDEYYKKIFNTRLREDSTAKGKWLTNKGGGYTATGVGGSITGRGFKIGIIDDPIKNREEAESSVYRDKIWSWYTSTFYTRQEGYGAIIIICTRWHLDDLVGRIEAQEEEAIRLGIKDYDEWEYITFPAINDKGEALWPSKYSISMLNTIKNSIGLYDFASLYQQTPQTKETQIFKKQTFRYFSDSEIKFRNLETFTLIDPAISDAKSADNWIVLTIGKERASPNIYRLEESAGKGNPDRMLAAIFYHQAKYNSQVWLETAAFQKILKRDIRELQTIKQQYFLINELKHGKTKTKEGRIMALVPLYNAGVVYHRREDTEYEKELLDFPMGKHDDRIDAMSFLNEALFERAVTDFSMFERPHKAPVIDPY